MKKTIAENLRFSVSPKREVLEIDGFEMEVTHRCKFLRENYRCVKIDICEDKLNYANNKYCGKELGMNKIWKFKRKDKEVKNGYGYDMEKGR